MPEDVETSRERGSPWRTALRTAGPLVLLGVGFLGWELGSSAWEFRAQTAASPVHLKWTDGGWLDLSGAAWPARWLYWAGHLWVIVFLWWRGRLDIRVHPLEWLLFGSVVSGIVAVHALVLGPLRAWIITPWLF